MVNQSKDDQKSQLTNLLLTVPALTICLSQYLWKMFYIVGIVPGLYWFFVFLDQAYLPLIVISGLVAIICFVLGKIAKSAEQSIVFHKVALGFLLTGFAIVFTLPIHFAQNTLHLHSVRTAANVYYLAAYPMFDVNFSVAECDFTGLVCRSIFRSGDVTDSRWKDSLLSYDKKKNVIELYEPEEGILFTHQVP